MKLVCLKCGRLFSETKDGDYVSIAKDNFAYIDPTDLRLYSHEKFFLMSICSNCKGNAFSVWIESDEE